MCISIHAPREGGDVMRMLQIFIEKYFNPRPPRGGRRSASCSSAFIQAFQSTPPARGATALCDTPVAVSRISIHAPREGGDSACGQNPCFPAGFQSTPPARGATLEKKILLNYYTRISIHAPREGGDC